MKAEKKASELFLKKYYQLKSGNELSSLLAGISEKNYSKLKEDGFEGDYWVNKKEGEKLKDSIKSDENSEKKKKVDTFLTKSLTHIDKSADEIKQWKETKEGHEDFTASNYTAGGMAGNAKSSDTQRRKAFRYILDTLLDKK